MVKKTRATKEQVNELLDLAMAHIKSVDYRVSLRWLFYRLLQDGVYKGKDDYINFKATFARARKTYRRGWRPYTLSDDTRQIIWRGTDSMGKKEWIDELECTLDKIQNQHYVLVIFYEANAMTNQFLHYTKNIPLVAFGGDPSIPYKYQVAMALNTLSKRYDKPIKILYFGDADKKGNQIRDSAIRDIKAWSSVDFEAINCGLTLEQAKKMKLPENPEKPNQYQWEALTDSQANKIIMKYVKKYQDESLFEQIEKQEQRILNWAKKRLN